LLDARAGYEVIEGTSRRFRSAQQDCPARIAVTSNEENVLTDKERALVKAALAASRVELDTSIPDCIDRYRDVARRLLAEVQKIYGPAAGSDYFTTSKLRYEQYFAIACNLPPGARLLEIGSAPGHVSIGLWVMGFAMICVNLNALYRSQYPSMEWLERLNVTEHDFEKAPLPFEGGSFDVVFFTEVLEHVAVKPVTEVLADIHRVCKPGATLVLSTPNVNNISNIFALLNGENIFWRPETFYGSLDRHNREFTPAEVTEVMRGAGFSIEHCYGFNCHSNWRGGGNEQAYRVLAELGDGHPLLRNTIMVVAHA
jgi:2-polyprenyl-3-methyl-5-hydroxy-6-metoxy-1,4-benzoquinol methylase